MSGQAPPEAAERVIYREERCGVRWPLVASMVIGWVVLIACGIAMNFPHLAGLGIVAAPGGILGLVMTSNLEFSLPIGIHVDGDEIQIGGMRTRQRLLRQGKWPPRKPFILGRQSRAVFTCQWEGARGLYLITKPREIRRLRRDFRRFLKRNPARIPLGVFRQGLAFSKAVLVIAHDARLISSDPPEFRSQRGQYVRLHGVTSPIWVVPTRNPEALRAALSQVPAPPVQQSLPPETLFQFTTGR